MNGMKARFRACTGRLGVWAALFAATVLLVYTPSRAAPPPTEAIDTSASCTASCHLEFGKKPHIHKAARTGTSCKNCHKPAEANKHAFKPLPANRSELCMDCHDEMEAKQKHLHKPFKAGNCTKCHDPHQSDEPKLLRKSPQKLCLGCHDDQEPSKKHLHKPFKAGNCIKCHDPHQSDQAKQLKKPVPQLCMGCHEADEFKGKVVHGPVAEGKCLECHHPHQTDTPRLLNKTTPELCFGCHAAGLKDAQGQSLPATKKLFDDKSMLHHRPFAEGKCDKCHQPHVSTSRRLLAKAYPADFYASYAADTYGLCFTCHASKAMDEPRTLTDTRFRNGNLNLHHRHVNRDKGRACGACHDPHGSPQARLVNQSFQFGNKLLALKYDKTPTGGSCATACHGPIKYDRCNPEEITLKTTPRQGGDASAEALKLACDKELAEAKEKEKPVELEKGKEKPAEKK
jgi:predicted CXXCH cytochrome family protein